MKKLIISIVACFIGMVQALATDVLTVEKVTLPQNGEAPININMEFQTQFKGYQLDVELDESLSLVLDAENIPIAENGFTGTDHSITCKKLSDTKYRFICVSMSNKLLPMTGSLLKLRVVGAETLAVGTILNGKITATEFTTVETEIRNLSDVPFTITITEPADPWLTLDENATEIPEATDGAVDIKVLRSIKADEWSTLCLPFEMTESQVKEAFGEDVQLAEFIDYEVNDDATEIKVDFEDANLAEGLLANYPYIIRTTQDVEEFMVTATIEPDEENAVAEYAEGRGARRHVYGTFYGTLHAGMMIPENCLFLSENKFWYSVGKTPMKAFRAYFELEDVLADRQNAKVSLNFGNSVPTGIGHEGSKIAEEGLYDLQGRRAYKDGRRLKSGIYVSKNKKVVVK